MFISMILALAFMAFTASAQNVTLYQRDECISDLSGGTFSTNTYVLQDLEGWNGCVGICTNVAYVSDTFMNLLSVSIQDSSKCYYWRGQGCGPPGSYQASAAGVGDNEFHCARTPELDVGSAPGGSWSFKCYKGSYY